MKLRPSPGAQLPQINLIPMLNAMLAILAFFVMVAVSLSLEQSVNLPLPADRYPTDAEAPPLIITQKEEGIFVDEESQTVESLLLGVRTYLEANPNGFVLLRPAPTLSYQDMMELLLPLQEIGSDRVSLVIREEPQDAP